MSKYSDTHDGYEAGVKAKTRPACAKEEHFAFLDVLRETGSINMFGARPSLMAEFPELDDKDAATVLSYWMRTPASTR